MKCLLTTALLTGILATVSEAKLILCRWDMQTVTNPPRCWQIDALPLGPGGGSRNACCTDLILQNSPEWWYTCVDDCRYIALIGESSGPIAEIRDGALYLEGEKAATIIGISPQYSGIVDDAERTNFFDFFSEMELTDAEWEINNNQLFIENVLVGTIVIPADVAGSDLEFRTEEMKVSRILPPKNQAPDHSASTIGPVLLYPNPSGGAVNLMFVNPDQDGEVSVLLHDNTGRLMKVLLKEQIYAKGMVNLSFDLSHLPSGSYYVVIKLGNKQIASPLLIN